MFFTFSQFSDPQLEPGYRSEVQERALVVSLQMFSLILERGVSLLRSQLERVEHPRLIVDEDMQVLLPAIKVNRLQNRPPLRLWLHQARGSICGSTGPPFGTRGVFTRRGFMKRHAVSPTLLDARCPPVVTSQWSVVVTGYWLVVSVKAVFSAFVSRAG